MTSIHAYGSDVTLDAVSVASDYVHGLVQFPLATPRDKDKGAFFDEELCRRESYSFSAARDHRNLSIQLARGGFCQRLHNLLHLESKE